MKNLLINKEISWLSFNERVLQEAEDNTVPLIERIRFLGIFSSNMDEFFRIRVAILKRLLKLGRHAEKIILYDPKEVLSEIQDKVVVLQYRFEYIYQEILKQLSAKDIYIINESQLNEEQSDFVKGYFHTEVRPKLIPVMLDQIEKFPFLRDHFIYLAVVLKKSSKLMTAIIEIPTNFLPRFIILPRIDNKKYIILLDDVIRFGLNEVFGIFQSTELKAYTVKLTRDAELEIESDISESYLKKILKSVKQRKEGDPVRFVYDEDLPKTVLQMFIKNLELEEEESILPGGRYHNFRDFMKFPDFGDKSLKYDTPPKLHHKDIEVGTSILNAIEKKDIMIHTCYQSFDYLIDLIREAAINKHVTSIEMTIYRAAKNSSVMNALINAAKNAKKVTVVLELQARFDEEANIYWADKLQEEGVNVIFGVPDLKIHSKLCLISCKKEIRYAVIGTGNFNEDTARIYSDVFLFTSDKRLTNEVDKIFDFFRKVYKPPNLKHLIVSPFQTRKKIVALIKNEIKNIEHKRPAYIFFKLNNLVDPDIIKNIYEAGNAGVKIKLIVRSMFSLKTEKSRNIEAFSIIDKYLEHSRIFIFANAGKPKYFISSADMMTRNLDSRVEVICPIYSKEIQYEIDKFIEIQCCDNVKARILNDSFDNQIRKTDIEKQIRAQDEFYEFLRLRHKTHHN